MEWGSRFGLGPGATGRVMLSDALVRRASREGAKAAPLERAVRLLEQAVAYPVRDAENFDVTARLKAKKADGRRVLVWWRDMEKLEPAVERRFLEARLKQEGPFDEAWINGDCAVPGVQSLDALFKRLLEEEERT